LQVYKPARFEFNQVLFNNKGGHSTKYGPSQQVDASPAPGKIIRKSVKNKRCIKLRKKTNQSREGSKG